MRVLYASLYDASFGKGGAEKVMVDILVAMKERFGYDVACAVNKGDVSTELGKMNIPLYQIEWSKLKLPATLMQLNRAVREFKPDVIHSHHRFTTFLFSLLVRHEAYLVHTEHVLRKDKKALFRTGDIVTAVHESVRLNLIEHFGVDSGVVMTIDNAVPPHKVDPGKLSELQKKWGTEDGKFDLLCIGRLEEQKGHRYLIEAVASLPLQMKNRLRVFLAGGGSLYVPLFREIKENGLEDVVYLLGHCESVPEWLEYSDAVVLPSLWEGMPLSVLESFAAAKAVLATDIPGTRDMVEDHKTGRLVPPRDSEELARVLRQWLDQEDKVREMGQNAGRVWKEKYSFDIMMEAYRRCYEAGSERS